MRISNTLVAGLLCIVGGTSVALCEIRVTTETLDSGRTFLLVSGEIGPNDRLDSFAALAASSEAQAVVFDSPGGNVHGAMKLGRMIRALKLDTVQIRKLECASACALAFLGGVNRSALPGSIGVHRSSFDPSSSMERDDAVAGVQAMTADILSYLGEMGVSAQFLAFSLRYDQNDMRYLSASEMSELNVTTAADGEPSFSRDAGSGDETVVANLPPPETLGLADDNAIRAIKNATARFKDAGMSGLQESSRACWRVVSQKRTLDSVQYCRMLDMVGVALDQAAVEQFGPRAHISYFTTKNRASDLVEGIIAAGVANRDRAASLFEHWNVQFNRYFR